MASVVQSGHPHFPPPPTFSQSSTESNMNGISRSQSALNSFDGVPSIASTPTPTPPASRHQQNTAYAVPSFNSMNGSFSQNSNTPRRNPHEQSMMPRQPLNSGHNAQIYTAVYSGVGVYEMEVNKIAVMRRREDSWLNATQILKVAGVEKGKRTKVLEKEILSGEHEKVQGGYGRYQGTWINYRRGVEFSRQYGVEELLRPLLEYDMGQDGLSMAGQGDLQTPTKEQAMAAQRKRNMMNGGLETRPPAQSPNGTFFKNISKSAANAVNAINKARFESPSRSGMHGRPAKLDRRSSQQQMSNSQDSAYVGSSQQSMQSLHSEQSFGRTDSNVRSFNHTDSATFEDGLEEPPRKRARQDSFAFDNDGAMDTTMHDVLDGGPSSQSQHPSADLALTGLGPLSQPTTAAATEKQQMLTSLFLDANRTDFSDHPALLHLSGEDLDIPIDATAHTALHWAATLARTSLLRALIAKGASIYRMNSGGETALIRAALTTNNLDQGSFPELLELLGPTIELNDARGRTVLHHIAMSSAVKGRGPACRYYLESLLEFVIRQGSAPNSQQNSFHDLQTSQIAKPIGLARFMSEIVNVTDISGDTALNLASRIGNRSIIQQLLEVGANPTIANRGGLRPVDFGVGGEPSEVQEGELGQHLVKAQRSTISKVNESSQELLKSITTLLADTESSFRAVVRTKQSLADQTHLKLRETTSALAEDRRRLTELQRTAEDRKALRQRIDNLRRGNDSQRVKLKFLRGERSKMRGGPGFAKATNGQLNIDNKNLPDQGSSLAHLPVQKSYLTSLPSGTILDAQARTHKKITAKLEQAAGDLHRQSSELESQLKKVVSMCARVSMEKVEEMLGGLEQAVESEGGAELEIGRLREFLRKVEMGE